MEGDHYKNIEEAEALLPTWFVPRMMDDTWLFGLLLVTGDVLCISHVDRVRRGPDGLWLDVQMLDGSPDVFKQKARWEKRFLCAPTSRTEASVQACHVIAAFELADT